jgi:hypothetical protein
MFHMVGIACTVASLALGPAHKEVDANGNFQIVHWDCADTELPTDYSSLADCVHAADKDKVPLPAGKDTWHILHCIQMP